jgi:hypothetical protein
MPIKPHQLYDATMKRGDAVRVAAEMGYTSGEVPRRWRRPQAGPNNLFTGEISPMMKAKFELLAQDRVNSETADVLLFSMFSDLARQRARLRPDNREMIVLALAGALHQAIKAFTIEASPELREVELYRAGGAIVRALAFVIGDDGAVDGVPMCMVDETPSLAVRAWRRLRGKQ